MGVTAVAGDVPGTTITYTLRRIPTAGLRSIRGTGVVSVAPRANIDIGKAAELELWVKASDGKLSSESRYVVTILNALPSTPIDVTVSPTQSPK